MAEDERSCFNCPFKDCEADSEETCAWIKGKNVVVDMEVDIRRKKRKERYHNDPEYRRRKLENAKRYYAERKAQEKAQNH